MPKIALMGVVFLVLVVLAFPVFIALGISAFIVVFITGDLSPVILTQRLIAGMYSFPMLAIPFFLLSGVFMSGGGITTRIINMFNSILGHIRGSLALTNVGASMFFAGVSGSAVADTSSIGAILIPAMKEEGYDSEFSAAITAASSIVGPIIPPSIPFIIYGVSAQVSILDLFLAGAAPGIVLGLLLMCVVYIISLRRNYPVRNIVSFRTSIKIIKKSFWALLMPIILIGGILTGVFTVTELAAVAALYSFIIGKFVYKTLQLNDIPNLMADVALDTALVMILVGATAMPSYILAFYNVPRILVELFLMLTSNKYVLLLLFNLVFLVAGMFLDSTPATLLLVPVLLPVAKAFGIDPIHFGVILVFNLMLGLLTPPVCFCLSLAAKIAKAPIGKVLQETWIFLLIGFSMLAVITYWPAFVLTLPRILNN